jgi:hypothetical protein
LNLSEKERVSYLIEGIANQRRGRKEDNPQETQKGINSKQTKYNLPTYLTYGIKKNKKPLDP